MPNFSLITILFMLVLALGSHRTYSQDSGRPDSVTQLNQVTVEGYISGQSLLRTPTSVGVLNSEQLRGQSDETLLPALNTVPGVRMEQRSPGSYRLSIRGSLLRSPWGVRNVKVYLDEFPLTDAGGNTYLNLLDARGIDRLEVLKGPHGSLFGANSGGVVLVSTAGRNSPDEHPAGDRRRHIAAGLSGGSYGLFHEHLGLRQRWDKASLDVNQAFLRTDGYRENSGMRRHYLQAAHRWNYRPQSQLKVTAFYADLDYATPGGLTLEQYQQNPRQARPAAGPNPGAVEQQAGIRTRTWFGGVSHQFQLRQGLRHLLAVFGSHTDFENPFITNYEVRDEHNYGIRTYLELDGKAFSAQDRLRWQLHLGLEWQRSRHEISNFDNLGDAAKGGLQASDAIRTRQYFYFTKLSASFDRRFYVEAALSLNYNRYAFDEISGPEPSGGNGNPENPGAAPSQDPAGSGERRFSPQWMPRLSLSYLLEPGFSWRASLSRGYSPPTTAEIRPSNIIINTGLNPETGWNYETGFRYMPAGGTLQADASVFYYRMEEAIVRRLEEGGDEYFVNAGGTGQFGLEALVSARLLKERGHGLLRGLRARGGYTFSRFRFRDYRQGQDDYSGNRLTGVPQHVITGNIVAAFPGSFSLSVQHYSTGRIPLDDANSVFADAYQLLQLQLSWRGQLGGNRLEFFAGGDNLLNEKYSLGNDINAFGGRFYNAAPPRNFYGGMRLILEP